MPIQLKGKVRIESATLPGVAFTVRRLAVMRRAERDMQTLQASARLEQIRREWREVMGPGDFSTAELINGRMAEMSPAEFQKVDALNREGILLGDLHLKPASIRTGLVSIEGITNEDGVPIETAEQLLQCATPELDELLEEVYRACEAGGGLDTLERKNSQ